MIDSKLNACTIGLAKRKRRGSKLVLGVLAICLVSLYITTSPPALQLPSPQNNPTSSVWLTDRSGLHLQAVRIDSSERRLQWTALEQISPALVDSVLIAEDRNFYLHSGVDFSAVAAALVQNTRAAVTAQTHRRGASTISMQLAGLLTMDTKRERRDWIGKLAQMRMAWAIERQATKEQILEAYLNTVYFRGEQRGITAASQAFFAKAPIGLTQKESVVLASMLASPQAKVSVIVKRSCQLLSKVAATTASCDGLDLPIARLNKPATSTGQHQAAPHYAQWLLKKQLINTNDLTKSAPVKTTIDLPAQRYAQRALAEQMRELANRQVEDGAIVVLDNRTGEVLVYVGSSGEYSNASFVDAAQAPRQAGSTLKPFLYGMAIDQRRVTAASLLDDSALAISTTDAQYMPRNYSPDFKGWVSVRRALAGSLNIPAVRTLAMLDVDEFAGTLRQLGLSTVNQQGGHYGFSLALGSADVRLIELTNAYRALANSGQWTAVKYLASNSSATGAVQTLEKTSPPALSAQAAYIVADVLADNEARATTFGLDSALRLPFRASVKTGTSKDMRDNWCIGFSEHFTVGVWIGNASGTPMRGVSGISGAAPIWNSVMRFLHHGHSTKPATLPEQLIKQTISFKGVTEAARSEYFIAGTQTATVELAARDTRAAGLIEYPINGAIFAIDPDIPMRKQVLNFTKSASIQYKTSWRLNGVTLAEHNNQWRLQVGRHQLELIDSTGRIQAQVKFEVRGPAQALAQSN